ncbi:T6SS effector BTH_I2691 family protein [Paraburkholderia fungorum]|uniref:Toxin VasX N-terminal region domain-containing protein n=1 Tax=Paraburkholderia agricolaris TaxID=2152888 RepID=A0ABW8ZR43_9BURK
MLLDTPFQSVSSITQSAIASSSSTTGKCNMCQKKGLPILPVRYSAVAATRAHGLDGVPVLMGGSFGAKVLDVAHKKARYTLRTLRYGFVYVFYPTTRKWQGYAVTVEGYVYDFPLDKPLDRSLEKPFTCKQTGHPELAQCITIENAEKAGTVYLAFSDVLWTKAVRDRYAANTKGCRDKRMQPFNAAGWFAKPGAGFLHAAPAKEVNSFVAEYKGGAAASFVVSPFPYRERAKEYAALNTAMDSLAPGKGAVFALWDPIGIAQELNQESRFAFDALMGAYEWGAWSRDTVQNLKAAVEAGAVQDNQSAADMQEGQIMENNALTSLFDGGKAAQRQIDELHKNTAATMGKAKEEAWEDYSKAVSEKSMEDFDAKMKADVLANEKAVLNPLSADHASWMLSDEMATVFQFDYDSQNLLTGIDYQNSFLRCMEGSSARKEAFDLMLNWAQGKVSDTKNIMLRAMALNHEPNVNHVLSAGDFPYVELRETTAKAIEVFYRAVDNVEDKNRASLPRLYNSGASLIYELGAPIAKTIADGIDTAAAKTLVLLTAMRTNHQVILRPVEGTQSQWITYYARQMWELMPAAKRPSMSSLKKSLYQQFTTQGTDGKKTTVPQFIIVDDKQLASFDKGAMTNATAAAQVSAPGNRIMLTEESIEKQFIPAFRKFIGGEVGANAIGAVFSIINFRFSSKDLAKATHFNNEEAERKYYASIANALGGIMQVTGYSIEAAKTLEWSLPKMLGEGTSTGLKVLGRFLGAPAAALGAWYDWNNAGEQWKEGHVVLSLAYRASALAGGTLAFLVVFNIGAIAVLPLTLFLIAIGLVILYLKERELTEFLGRSYFGTNKKGKEGHFETMAEEQKAYTGLSA